MSRLTHELKESQYTSSTTNIATQVDDSNESVRSGEATVATEATAVSEQNNPHRLDRQSYIQGLTSKKAHGFRKTTTRIANNNTTQRIYRFIRRPLKRGVRAKARKWFRRLCAMSVSELLYKLSFHFLSVIFIGLIVCTMVDIIPQSLVSGQFWNTIIIILTCAIIFVLALILYIVRVLDTRRSVNRIPRAYLVQDLGLPKKSFSILADERKRCIDIYKSQVDIKTIHHPGLSNPGSELGSLGHFMETIESIPHFIEWKVQSIDSRFTRPVGCDFRSYLELIVAHHIVDQEDSGYVEGFIDRFEHARFSGNQITETEFKNLMLAMCSVLIAISRNSQNFGKGELLPYGIELESLLDAEAPIPDAASSHTRYSAVSEAVQAVERKMRTST
ncbi:Defect at low temperature protein 1 [Wickerhamiella sorbophila]|uniref:Defect at low temperature protein 1 n=1 Tax=Wickerhamiella sorbophila TaxID=45607 RepID=A0A2T0FI58_9ASCO|nr:Defect at low temperature protein 1 [Wickerhamiella sorbophila]PRT54683.1 Defect at low temperature protein 1 [Wickerhamiella sorbophila]